MEIVSEKIDQILFYIASSTLLRLKERNPYGSFLDDDQLESSKDYSFVAVPTRPTEE